jgi:hypothetical protein
MSHAKRISDLERKAGAAGESEAVTIDDRQEHVNFIQWLRRALGKYDKKPVDISPEEEKAFRPPFTVHHTKSELEERDRTITDWLRDAIKGGPRK